MVTDSALRWAACHVVLHAKTTEHAENPVVHTNGDRHFQDSLRFTQVAVYGFVQTDQARNVVKLLLGHLPDVNCLNGRSLNRHSETSVRLHKKRDASVISPRDGLTSTSRRSPGTLSAVYQSGA